MDFLNYLARLHCQMQDKNYVWLQWFLTQHFHTDAVHLDLTGLESKDFLYIKLKCCHVQHPVSLPLFLAERVKHLQPTYPTHDLVEVQAALSQVPHFLHHVWTQLLPVTTGAPSYQIFQSTADCFQVVVGLHFQIVILVTAAQYSSENTGLLLLSTQATEISVPERPITLLAPCDGGTTLRGCWELPEAAQWLWLTPGL